MNISIEIDKSPKKVDHISDYLRIGHITEHISNDKYKMYSLDAYVSSGNNKSRIYFFKDKDKFGFNQNLPLIFTPSIGHRDLGKYPINWNDFLSHMEKNVPGVSFEVRKHILYDVNGNSVEMPGGFIDATFGPYEISDENLMKSMYSLGKAIDSFYQYARGYAKDLEEDFKIIVRESSDVFSDTLDLDLL